VDPKIETEQPGGSPDPRKAEEGANYLRRLKAHGTPDAPSTPAATSRIVVPATPTSPSFKERRRSPRFQCSGSAEFRPEGSDVRMWGTLTDVSLHGCYVEMNNTFPVGTNVSLTIEALGIRVNLKAAVRVSYPFLGRGMCFSEIEPGQQIQLEQLLAALAGTAPLPDSAATATPDATSTHSLADVDAKTMLDELTEFFRGNHLLSREEFYQMANRARR
jgi:hypothetical protein